MINKPRAESLVTELLTIPGKSGEEADVAQAIIGHLQSLDVPGMEVAFDTANMRIPFGGNCGNLIVKLPGTHGRTREARRMFMAHLDTVPICVGCQPVKKGNVIRSSADTGLGADDRAGAATLLTALVEIVEKKLPHPPLTFLWCVQEEVGLMGARHVDIASLNNPAMAFNFDGGSPSAMTLGATGAYRLTIHITGVPAHAGVHPERGVSAIAVAALAVASLKKDGWHGLILKGKNKGTSNVGIFRAGDATNVVTESAMLRAEVRSHSPSFRKRILDAYKKAFAAAAKVVRNEKKQSGSVKFDVSLDYDSFALKEATPAVKVASAAVKAMKMEPQYKISNGGLDANWMNAHGIPTVSFGCGQHDIHTTDEWLDLKEYFGACELAVRLATSGS
ncbi:MAG: M20/M25/M40 family metallo-hydrolase [Phycisphaeraceae bacterium]